MIVSFFGRLRDALGAEREVEARRGETVADLRARLAELFPYAAEAILGPRVRACVGETLVDEQFLLDGHERVEFLPPLSGG